MPKTKVESYIILYFDILGYSTYVWSMDKEQQLHFYEILAGLTDVVKNIKAQYKKLLGLENKVLSYVFSDNFLIAIKPNSVDDDANCTLILLNLAAQIQAEIIKQNIFVRGCIIKGDLYAKRDVLQGRGIIEAHILESHGIVFPRVFVGKELIESFESLVNKVSMKYGEVDSVNAMRGLYREDSDSAYFVDYLEYALLHKADDKFFADHRDSILHYLHLCEAKSRIFKKYFWCALYHSLFCAENGMLDYVIDLDELMLEFGIDESFDLKH